MDYYSFTFNNIENLFDTVDAPLTLDDNFTAPSDKTGKKTACLKNETIRGRPLQEYTDIYKETPFRSYVGKKYFAGVSDHFPVNIVFTLQK